MDRLTKEDFDVVMDDKQEMECSSSDTDAQRQLTAVEDRSTRTDDSGTTATFQGMRAKNDSHLIQIKASNAEIQRRIAAFIEKKQNEVDENNRQEFCSVFQSMEDSEDSCARTDAVFVPRAGGKSHMKVTRVVNSYGPQTRALGLGQEASPSKPLVKTEPTHGIEERLQNIETHLKVKGSSKTDVYSRLKVLEERVLFLESLSPEYFTVGAPPPRRQRSQGRTSSAGHKEMTLSEIEEKMNSLREKLVKKSTSSS